MERNEGEGKEKISSILAERGLPSLEELASIFHGVGRSARSASLPIFADSFWHEGVTVRRVSVAVVGRPGPWVLQRVRSVTGPWAIQRGRATGRGGRGRPGRSEPRSTAPEKGAGPAADMVRASPRDLEQAVPGAFRLPPLCGLAGIAEHPRSKQ